MLDDDVAHRDEIDGAPVTREHGGPARVIIPKLTRERSEICKAITFLDHR